MRPPLPFLAAAAAMLSGCSHIYVVEAESRIQPLEGDIRSYTIRRVHAQDPHDTLRYQEAEELLKSNLAAKGLYEAPKPELADVQVEFDYGMTEPRVHLRKVKDPIYSSGGTRLVQRVVGVDKNGNAIKAIVPVHDLPELIGYREYIEREIVVEKHVRLIARVNHPQEAGDAPPPEVWNVYVHNTDDSTDLRRYLPVMIAVVVDYVGKDSNGVNTFKVTLEDGVPVYISGGYDQARTAASPGSDLPAVAASDPVPDVGNTEKQHP